VYDINLIKEQIVPHHHRQVMFSVVSFTVLAFILTALSVLFFSIANTRVIDVYAKELHNLEDDLSLLYPGNPTHEELGIIFSRIEPDLREISAGVGKRMEMTSVWEGIADAVPDSVWLTSVTLKAPDDGKAKGKEGGMVIQGRAAAPSGKRGSALIREFADAIVAHDVLARHVADAKYTETEIEKISDLEVIGFEIVCKLR